MGKNSTITQQLDHTFAVMNKKGRGSLWQIAVPNGAYTVTISAGNSQSVGMQSVEANGVIVVNGRTTAKHRWITSTQTVTVTDGMLKLTHPRSGITRINFIDIVQQIAQGGGTPSGGDSSGGTTSGGSTTGGNTSGGSGSGGGTSGGGTSSDQTLTVSGTNVTLAVDPDGGVRTIIDGVTTDYAAGQWSAVQYKSAGVGETFNALATVVPTTISGQYPSVTHVTIGDPAVGVQNITAPITIDASADNMQVTISDAGDIIPRQVVATRGSTLSTTVIHGLAPADITLAFTNVLIDTGSGDDTISMPTGAVGNLHWNNTGGSDQFNFGNGTLQQMWTLALVTATGGTNRLSLDSSQSFDSLTLQSTSTLTQAPAGANSADYTGASFQVDPAAGVYWDVENIVCQTATTTNFTFTEGHQSSETVTSFTASTASYPAVGALPASVVFNGDANDMVSIEGRMPGTSFNITSNQLSISDLDSTAQTQVHFNGVTGAGSPQPKLSIQSPDAGPRLAKGLFTAGSSSVSFGGVYELDVSAGNNPGDYLYLNYTPGNFDAFTPVVNLSGTWGLWDFPTTGDPLANTTLIFGDRFYIGYENTEGAALQALVRKYLAKDLIQSAIVNANRDQGLTVGYADQADGVVPGQPYKTVELYATKIGDVNLDGHVTQADLAILQAHLNQPGTWDEGDLNYDGIVDDIDLALLQQYLGN